MKILFTLCMTLFIISCSSTSYLEVSSYQESTPPKEHNYSNYWDALRHFQFDQSFQYAKTEVNLEKKELATILKNISHNQNTDLNISKLELLYQKSSNDSIKDIASWWSKYYSNASYHNNQFLDAFGVELTDLYQLNGKNNRDSLKIILRDSPIIQISIGNISYNMLIDTGSPWTIFTDDAFDKLNLKKIENVFVSYSNSSGQKIKTFNSLIPQITFDKSKINNVPVQISGDINFKKTIDSYSDSTIHVSGILGWDVIKEYYIKLDFRNQYIIIDENHLPNDKRNIFCTTHPFVPVIMEMEILSIFILIQALI